MKNPIRLKNSYNNVIVQLYCHKLSATTMVVMRDALDIARRKLFLEGALNINKNRLNSHVRG